MEVLYFLLVLSLACSASALSIKAHPPPQFNVVNFGAVGDGNADDTQAFSKAWSATCGAFAYLAMMVVPAGKMFLVKPTIFKGPCKPSLITVQIEGTILAPDSPNAWKGLDSSLWLQFELIYGLTVTGPGEINGRGPNWWKQSCKYNKAKGCTTLAPTAIKFIDCQDLRVSHLSSVDSAQVHFLILGGLRVAFENITITAPRDSPNTDGIHIHASKHVTILHSTIGTGDDCISIGDYINDITISRISCGPGHGISVGSLGMGGTAASVQGINVSYVHFHETSNGARIKTWQGGAGFVKGVSFEHCNFTNVKNPIVIDQYYCTVANSCPPQKTGVQISDVRYVDFQGTTQSVNAISLNCSDVVPCTLMHFGNVNLRPVGAGITQATCINAHGSTNGDIVPPLACLQR